MSIESIKKAYQEWEVFESEPTKKLKGEINQVFDHPTDESDKFFKKIADDCNSDNTDGFWIGQAIKYSHRDGVNKKITQKYLENVISDYTKYWIIGNLLSSAANMLGSIASYPNEVLRKAIEKDRYDKNNERAHDGKLSKIASDGLRAAAYGAYVMTATNFQTGFDAGQVLEASGQQPTVEMAETFIAKWQKEHRKE